MRKRAATSPTAPRSTSSRENTLDEAREHLIEAVHLFRWPPMLRGIALSSDGTLLYPWCPMPRLSPVSWRVLVRVFERDGYEVDRMSGSHIVMAKPGITRPLVIPRHREVKVPIIRNNLRTAGMSLDRYFELL